MESPAHSLGNTDRYGNLPCLIMTGCPSARELAGLLSPLRRPACMDRAKKTSDRTESDELCGPRAALHLSSLHSLIPNHSRTSIGNALNSEP